MLMILFLLVNSHSAHRAPGRTIRRQIPILVPS